MKNITDRKEFLELKDRLGVRDDWHEPDEQEVAVVMVKGAGGNSFDNASCCELEDHIKIKKNGKPVAMVNLALLCAWASGYKD